MGGLTGELACMACWTWIGWAAGRRGSRLHSDPALDHGGWAEGKEDDAEALQCQLIPPILAGYCWIPVVDVEVVCRYRAPGSGAKQDMYM